MAFVAAAVAVPVQQDGHHQQHHGGHGHAGRSNWSGDYDGHVDAQPNWESDWNAANENWKAGQQRIAAANAAAVNSANSRWNSAVTSHAGSNPRWACNLPGAVCTDDLPHHGHGHVHVPAPVAHHHQDGHQQRHHDDGQYRHHDAHHQRHHDGHNQHHYYDHHHHQPSPWRDAPADPRSLWACAVNPSACTHDVNWAVRGAFGAHGQHSSGHGQQHQG